MSSLKRLSAVLTRTIRTLAPTLILVLSVSRMPAEEPSDCSADSIHKSYTLWETISGSVCGKADPDRPWKPLGFGFDGWNQPWISPPNGDSGAVRQGWINDFQAFFNRNVFGVYNYSIGVKDKPDAQQGVAVFESPLSRRYMFGVIVPFVNNLNGGDTPSKTGFGDVTFENRWMLTETRNLTLSANLDVTTPTGERSIGADRTVIFPFLAFWTDVGHGVAVRGGVGTQLPVDSRPDGVDGTGVVNLCIGQTLTKHDAAPFGDFTYFVCTDYFQGWGPTHHSFVSLTPGYRTHLGHNWFLLNGVQVPVTGPRSFETQFTAVLVKGW
jgi:hypothetical protein